MGSHTKRTSFQTFKEEDGFGLCCSSRHYSGVQEAAIQSSGIAKAMLASSESELGRKMMGLQFLKVTISTEMQRIRVLQSQLYSLVLCLQSQDGFAVRKKKKKYGAIC